MSKHYQKKEAIDSSVTGRGYPVRCSDADSESDSEVNATVSLIHVQLDQLSQATASLFLIFFSCTDT